MRITISDILYVKTVVEEKNLSKAADKLLISQPALSQTIQRLEYKLGVPLFFRKNNTFQLTPAGEELVQSGKEMLFLSKQLEQKIDHFKLENEKRLRIGSSWFYSSFQLCRIVAQFKREFPGVSLEITEKLSADVERMVLEGDLDICLAPVPLRTPQLSYEMLPEERILFAMSKNHPLSGVMCDGNENRPFANLSLAKDEPFVSLFTKRFHKTQSRLCREAGFEPNITYVVYSWLTVISFIAEGIGVGFLPESLVDQTSEHFSPKVFRVESSNAAYHFAIAYRNGDTLSQIALRFIEIAKNVTSLP